MLVTKKSRSAKLLSRSLVYLCLLLITAIAFIGSSVTGFSEAEVRNGEAIQLFGVNTKFLGSGCEAQVSRCSILPEVVEEESEALLHDRSSCYTAVSKLPVCSKTQLGRLVRRRAEGGEANNGTCLENFDQVLSIALIEDRFDYGSLTNLLEACYSGNMIEALRP
jgi:hypothetical protein